MEARMVVVTGAASGIGRAIARRFAREGARLGLLDRDQVALGELAREIGTAATALGCDVTSRAQCEHAIRELEARLGGLDVLVNNAGITHLSRFAETDPDVLRAVMEVNFFGAVHCTQAALPALVRARGLVVAISSVAGFAPLAGRAGYAASKHALEGLFESIRAELAPDGVGVLIVRPGFTETSIGAHALGGDGGSARGPRTTTGRPATPEAVADAVHRAVRERRRRIVLTPVGHLSWWLWRLAPDLYQRIMARRLLT
jgi:NAD(P)-dependent dehydrogenase (short-subunit alcohol dehydrogenase family)